MLIVYNSSLSLWLKLENVNPQIPPKKVKWKSTTLANIPWIILHFYLAYREVDPKKKWIHFIRQHYSNLGMTWQNLFFSFLHCSNIDAILALCSEQGGKNIAKWIE